MSDNDPFRTPKHRKSREFNENLDDVNINEDVNNEG